LSAALTLAALLPSQAWAQAEPGQREGSWEFNGGAGVMYLSNAFAQMLAARGFSNNSAKPGRWVPAAAIGLGYNFNRHWGFGIGGQGATGSGVKYLTDFAAITYTGDLNATTSPFFNVGAQLTRVTGNGRKDHPSWGAQAGVGLRHFVGENLALRLEARMQFEHYQAMTGSRMAYNPIATVGLSYFFGGRHEAPAVGCPVCGRPRVDTVTLWRTPAPAKVLPPIVLRDTVVLEGINFDFDSSALTPESYVILDRVADALNDSKWSNSKWEIQGHTSSIGSAQYNMELSERRAEAVRAYLVSRGVQNSRLVAKGYGETQPMYPNDSEGRNWRNRRVAMVRLQR
jgi:OOP family OmpA-OmpF porin